MLVWLAVAYLTRYSSARRAVGDRRCPIVAWAIGLARGRATFVPLAALVWFKHLANIRRLLAGTEHKIGQA